MLLMKTSEKLEEAISSKIKVCLNLEKRIKEKKLDIEKGDKHPFLLSLFGYEFLLKTKIGQSLQTTFGTLYENICYEVALYFGNKCEKQKKIYGYIDDEIILYLDRLENINYIPNRKKEISDIRSICKKQFHINKNKRKEYSDSTVDVFVETNDGKKILIDITTVKNNKKSFMILKKKTLRWAALMLSNNPELDIETYFAIPYNPEGKNIEDIEYNSFNKYYDRKDLLVGDELWKKVSNNNFSIVDLIKIFDNLGDTIKKEITSSLKEI